MALLWRRSLAAFDQVISGREDSLSFIGGRYELALFSQIKIITTTVSKQSQSSDTRSKNALFLRLEIEIERERVGHWLLCICVCANLRSHHRGRFSARTAREPTRYTHTHQEWVQISIFRWWKTMRKNNAAAAAAAAAAETLTHTGSLSLQFARELSRKREKSPSLAESPILGSPRQSKRQSLRFAKAISAAPYHRETSAFLQNEKYALAFLSPSFHFSLSWISFVCSQETLANSSARICILWSRDAAFSWDL